MYKDQEAVIAVLAVERELIDPVRAVDLLRRARSHGSSPFQLLRDSGLVTDEQLTGAVAAELGIEYVDLFSPNRKFRISQELFDKTSSTWLERFTAIPLFDEARNVAVAAADPQDPGLNDYLSMAFPDGYRTVLAPAEQIRQMLLTEMTSAASSAFAEAAADTAVTGLPGTRGPVLDWLDNAITSSVAQRASDLHFELTEDGRLLVRFRIDGDLTAQPFPLVGRETEVIGALMSRATMDPANLREPQDGSFRFVVAGRAIDVRASMIPTITGVKLVLRLLDPSNLKSISQLGFGPEIVTMMRRAINQPQGLIVVAGPTGSGKTTTLYALLTEVDAKRLNVMTVENPVEYRLPVVSQIPIRHDLGDRSITFARALRTILRLDPDVILVGECRDTETVRVTLDAALTGHLVLSTVHAPSAAGVFNRFSEMGAASYLIAEAMSLSVSQRLVRRLHSCKEMSPPTDEELHILADNGITAPKLLARPRGCAACNGRKYQGRISLAEVVAPDAGFRRLLAAKARADEQEAYLDTRIGVSYVPYRVDGERLLHDGTTSLSEVVRALSTGTM